MPNEQPKSPIDAALDLFVYAPLGLAITARDNLPDLVAKGRKQLTSQVMMARMMGQYAVAEGRKDAEKRLAAAAETLGSLGRMPQTGGWSPATTRVNQTSPTPAATNGVASSNGITSSDGVASSNGATGAVAATVAAPAAATSASAPSSDHLAIHGYDTLSASQVVQRLAGLAPDELASVRDYETATRGRRTILSKIGQLQAGSTS